MQDYNEENWLYNREWNGQGTAWNQAVAQTTTSIESFNGTDLPILKINY